MKSILTLLIIITLTISCTNFDGDKYWGEEDRAIVDLIPKMVEAEYMIAHNDYGTNRPTVIIIEDLFNELAISEYDSVSDIDRQQLEPLTSKQINSRKITLDLFTKLKELNVKLISQQEFEKHHKDNLVENVNRDKLFGYLWISRIVFTDDFQSGYVSFNFFCGEACTWNSVLEIKKVNGRWTQGKFLFGGIA
jgi:hypothetical protein